MIQSRDDTTKKLLSFFDISPKLICTMNLTLKNTICIFLPVYPTDKGQALVYQRFGFHHTIEKLIEPILRSQFDVSKQESIFY